jgi:citrate lyase subunit alpha/citrate CoA-transferase
VERVGCVTTPGETVDAIVTEAGVAVNPKRAELADRLRAAGVDLCTIEQLHARALAVSGGARPLVAPRPDARIIGVAQYRDGSVIDVIKQVS